MNYMNNPVRDCFDKQKKRNRANFFKRKKAEYKYRKNIPKAEYEQSQDWMRLKMVTKSRLKKLPSIDSVREHMVYQCPFQLANGPGLIRRQTSPMTQDESSTDFFPKRVPTSPLIRSYYARRFYEPICCALPVQEPSRESGHFGLQSPTPYFGSTSLNLTSPSASEFASVREQNDLEERDINTSKSFTSPRSEDRSGHMASSSPCERPTRLQVRHPTPVQSSVLLTPISAIGDTPRISLHQPPSIMTPGSVIKPSPYKAATVKVARPSIEVIRHDTTSCQAVAIKNARPSLEVIRDDVKFKTDGKIFGSDALESTTVTPASGSIDPRMYASRGQIASIRPKDHIMTDRSAQVSMSSSESKMAHSTINTNRSDASLQLDF